MSYENIEAQGRVRLDKNSGTIVVGARRHGMILYNFGIGVVGPIVMLSFFAWNFSFDDLLGDERMTTGWLVGTAVFVLSWLLGLSAVLAYCLYAFLGELRSREELCFHDGKLQVDRLRPGRKRIRREIEGDSLEAMAIGIKMELNMNPMTWGAASGGGKKNAFKGYSPCIQVSSGDKSLTFGHDLDQKEIAFLLQKLKRIAEAAGVRLSLDGPA